MTRKLVVIAAVVVVGVLVDLAAGADPPGFGAGIGLTGTLLLTFGAQGLARLVKRDPDHYDRVDLPWPREDTDG